MLLLTIFFLILLSEVCDHAVAFAVLNTPFAEDALKKVPLPLPVPLLPTTLSTFSGGQSGPVMSTVLAYFGPGQPAYLIFFTAMIVFFTYFYTREVSFKTDEVADNLKNQNGFVPGIRPGAKTAEYLDYVVTRILVLGSGYLALVCLLPEVLRSQFSITAYFGGTSILIIVSVGMDTIQQVQSHLLAHQYDGLLEKSQLRGKRRSKKGGVTRQ